MPVGSTLLLFTDGLVECRGEPLDDGLERLKAAAASIPRGTPEQACDYLLTALMVGSRFGALAQAH
jgi:serine phosphatase RsbU (regulator of sigma subunit)